MRGITNYASLLCALFLIMVYCDWYCTFVIYGNDNREPIINAFTLYHWNYNDEAEGLIIGQALGKDENGEHGIIHTRFIRNEEDEVYFDLYGRSESPNTGCLSIIGKKWGVTHNGRAFKVIDSEQLIETLCETDSFNVVYGGNTFKFKPGKLKRHFYERREIYSKGV